MTAAPPCFEPSEALQRLATFINERHAIWIRKTAAADWKLACQEWIGRRYRRYLQAADRRAADRGAAEEV